MAKAKKKTSAKKKAGARVSTKRKKAPRKTGAKKAGKKKPVKKKTTPRKKSRLRTAAKKKAVSKKRPAKKKPAIKAQAEKKVAKTKAVKKKPLPAKKLSRSRAKNTAVAKTAIVKPAAPVVRKRTINLDDVKLPKGYNPLPKEAYMNPKHLLYFRNKLQEWRDELIVESQETLEHLRSEIRDVGDEAERASRESDNILELRTRDRYRKLLKKIDDAMKRIEDGSYGYCEETGEEIGLERLEARPIATLTVDAQERRELFQRQFRDDR